MSALTLRALKSHNITNDVVVAQDGVQAIDYLFGGERSPGGADCRPSVLLDLKLPKVNGMEVLPADPLRGGAPGSYRW